MCVPAQSCYRDYCPQRYHFIKENTHMLRHAHTQTRTHTLTHTHWVNRDGLRPGYAVHCTGKLCKWFIVDELM